MPRCAASLSLVLSLSCTACGGAAASGAAASGASTTAPGTTGALRPRGPIVASEGAINGTRQEPPLADSVATGSPAESADMLVSIGPGFVPDPIVRRGVAGGPMPAASMAEFCAGYLPEQPSVLLKVEPGLSGLRILVHTQGDATLVVQLANGRILCNDDSEGLNPIIEGIPPGRHRVWVGTYGTSDIGTPYTIAFTQQPTLATYGLDGLPTTP
jgi:hypothetical protein